jgi:hypothetical protein
MKYVPNNDLRSASRACPVFTRKTRAAATAGIAACAIGATFLGAVLEAKPVKADGPPPSVAMSASGVSWAHVPFASAQAKVFSAEVDATPLGAAIDGGVGLSYAPINDFRRLTCAARFNSNGYIDAMNGGGYQGPGLRYVSTGTYHFHFDVDVPNKTYSVYVTPPGGTQVAVGRGFAFRSGQPPVPNFATWSAFCDAGSMKVGGFSAGATTRAANAGWLNMPFTNQISQFAVEFDATPSANKIDAVMALSSLAQTSFAGFACLVRFNEGGFIDARNGSAYTPSSIPYSAGVICHFRLIVDVPSHTYTAYVTPSGRSEVLIGAGLHFRSEQSTTGSLNNMGVIVDSPSGSVRTANFAVRGGLDRFGIRELYPTVFGGREWTAQWDNGAARTFNWGSDPYDAEFHGRGDSVYRVDGGGIMTVSGGAPRLYVYDPWFFDKDPFDIRRYKTWNNVEVTAYMMRVQDDGTAFAGLVAGAKIRHCPDYDPVTNGVCQDRGMYGKLTNDGRALFTKEIHHEVSYANQPQQDYFIWPKLPYNQWIGMKFIARDVDQGQHVKVELWRDLTGGVNGGRWEKVLEYVDQGAWGVGYTPCSPGTNPAQILTGPNLSVFLREDNVTDARYKWFSIRELPGS